jgi:hypothetical protein
MSTDVGHQEAKMKSLDCTRMNSFGYYSLLDAFLIFENTIRRPEHELTELFEAFPWTSNISKANVG